MPSYLLLELDTHAPVVTWGAVGGATAGELLQVGYTLNEPALVSATIQLADGRSLALTDTGLTLEALLPPDTPNGNATIRAVVRDEVLNQATRALVVHLTGVIVTPEPTTAPESPGWPVTPRARRPAGPKVITSRSRARGVAPMRHSWGTRRYLATGVASSAQAISTSASTSSRATAAAGGVHLAHHVAAASSRAVSRGTVRRRDGGDLEAMVALGLV